MMEAARTSETLVNFYQTTQRYNPEDSHLHTHCCENLKSYMNKVDFFIQKKLNPRRQVAMAPRKFALARRIVGAVLGIKMFFHYFENISLTVTTLSDVHLKNLSCNHG
jgi:hypothetical protein